MKKINNTELEKINGGNIINDICFGADAGYITYKVALTPYLSKSAVPPFT